MIYSIVELNINIYFKITLKNLITSIQKTDLFIFIFIFTYSYLFQNHINPKDWLIFSWESFLVGSEESSPQSGLLLSVSCAHQPENDIVKSTWITILSDMFNLPNNPIKYSEMLNRVTSILFNLLKISPCCPPTFADHWC